MVPKRVVSGVSGIEASFDQNPAKGRAGWNQFKKREGPGGWGADWQDLSWGWGLHQIELGGD